MNKTRREALAKLATKLDEIKCALDTLASAEQDYRDLMPESRRESEKGERVEAAVSGIEDAVSEIEDAISNIETAQEY